MVPVDILDHIFSYLNRHSLEAVSSINSFFSSVAERHRYADIILTTSHDYDDSKALAFTSTTLLDLLEKRPHIANYIFNLTVCISGHRLKLPAILDLLQNLRNLTIEQGLIVDIDGRRDVLNIPLPLLRDFWLPNVDLYDRHHAPLLKHLSLDYFPHSLLKVFTPWIANFSNNLRYFKAFLSFGSGYNENKALCTIAPILCSCSNTLTVLIFHLTFRSLPPGGIPLGYEVLDLPHLKEASFYMTKSAEVGDNIIIPFFVLAQLLRTTPNLESLSLCFAPYTVRSGVSLSPEQLDWSEVDAFLETRSRSVGFTVDLSVKTEELWLSPKWTVWDIQISLLKHPNIKRMMEQHTLVISEGVPFDLWLC